MRCAHACSRLLPLLSRLTPLPVTNTHTCRGLNFNTQEARQESQLAQRNVEATTGDVSALRGQVDKLRASCQQQSARADTAEERASQLALRVKILEVRCAVQRASGDSARCTQPVAISTHACPGTTRHAQAEAKSAHELSQRKAQEDAARAHELQSQLIESQKMLAKSRVRPPACAVCAPSDAEL